MSTRTRVLTGVSFFVCVLLGCAALLKSGVYGWTVFIVIPLVAGASRHGVSGRRRRGGLSALAQLRV